MNIPLGKLFYVNIENLTAKSGHSPKFMIVATASDAPPCIINACDNEPCNTESGGQNLTQCDATNSVNAVHCKTTKCQKEQIDRQIAVKESNGIVNLNR